ncbi:E3 ubiquitin-protein ligase RNFT1 isoform X1 [Bactrocera neohumeralis]|uniref:E3 ubiquitin-protein ligase RNFT1 n=1 Tax=Bactrocera tryoni TaxID=59916 RepID=UPI001A97A171|nr:E3 ubiquitin-protein ligase RNFT1 [Bactrocera tryoni]XP_050330728.1 E3 ubiquitin-protein ligase RNFT1 isoform X1 [Bactrocera neohumeralis]
MNNSNINNETEANRTLFRLQANDIEVNVSNVTSPDVHNVSSQNTPLIQQSFENIRIDIEENAPENLESTSETRNSHNIMEHYARFIRDQVAEVTRSRLGNIIAASGSGIPSHQNTGGISSGSNYNRVHSLPNSLGNLNNVFSPEVLRSFSTTNNFDESARHSHDNDINSPIMFNRNSDGQINSVSAGPHAARSSSLVFDHHINFRNNVAAGDINNFTTPSNALHQTNVRRDGLDLSGNVSTDQQTHSIPVIPTRGTEETATSTNELYNTSFQDIVIPTIRHCLHYIPFACILFVKFIYDHSLAILDIITLQFVMYCVNKSLQAQVIRLDQKKNLILIRDLLLVAAVITLRLLASSTSPDPFGLLLSPPTSERNTVHQVIHNLPQDTYTPTTDSPNTIENTIIIPKIISLTTVIYYIAVNDLLLKLITISIKLVVTLIPLRAIRHKSRTRFYVFIEFFSQFYRSLVPIPQWLLFLFESYSGLHAISGVMFSSTYIVLKGCELADRGKTLKKSFNSLLKDVNKFGKPEKDNFDTSEELCAICQDAYVSPVVLECGHIFCDSCVTTWFKREQTCPMCRAKVGDNLAWHDGTTTFFYQLY